MEHILSLSYGKDSLACLGAIDELGWPLDRIVHAEVWATDTIPADSPRYKALGNSIALPQWWWLTCKMARHLPEHATLGSLFDGIGGFPLMWETRHGKGTALWASEIEEFPIAVTKRRFGE